MTENNFLSRAEILIGAEGLARLAAASVIVIGVGGVGSHAAEALARAGVGRLILIDGDVIDVTNINRQAHALHSSVGRAKAEAMRERIADINPSCDVSAKRLMVTAGNAAEIYDAETKIDFIVDAIDCVAAKLAVIKEAQDRNIKIISAMGAANRLRPEALKIADIYETSVCPLARVIRRELKKRGSPGLTCCYSTEPPVKTDTPGALGSVSFVPPVSGYLMAGYIVREMIGWARK